MTDRVDTIVIGAGLAGLSAAFRLSEQGHSFKILENSSSIGGWIQKEQVGPALFDRGPKSFRLLGTSQPLFNLLEGLNITDKIVIPAASSKSRYILYKNKLEPLPNSILKLATSQLTKGFVTAYIKDLITKSSFDNSQTSVYEYLKQVLPEHILKYCVDPMITGIYAGDIKKLGFQDCFQKPFHYLSESTCFFSGLRKYQKTIKQHPKPAWAQELKGSFFSLQGGLFTLVEALEQKLQFSIHKSAYTNSITKTKTGYLVSYDQSGQKLKALCKNIILATPTATTSQLLNSLTNTISYLEAVEHASITSIYCSWDNKQELPEGFGYLVPSSTQIPLLGCIFDSNLFHHQFSNNTPTRITLMMGGVHNPNINKQSNQKILDDSLDFIKNHLSINVTPDNMSLKHQLNAIPQPYPGHRNQALNLQKSLLQHHSIALCGSTISGVSIPEVIEGGYTAANLTLSF